MGFEHLFVIAALTVVVVKAGGRGKREVKAWYHRQVTRWKGSRPGPDPVGVKIGAGTATALVAGILWTRGFWRGLREGWPQGLQTGQEWYAQYRRTRDEKREQRNMHRCPECRYDLARNGWPERHNNWRGQLCPYEWAKDPKWKRCATCRDVLIPGEAGCTRCALKARSETSKASSLPRCAFRDETGQCTEQAGIDNNSIYCKTHKAQVGTSENSTQQPLRLVHNSPPKGGGKETQMAVETATGGDVRNLEQAIAELEAIRKEATSELEDAQAELERAEQDLARYERFANSMAALKFSGDIVDGITPMRESAASRQQAAKERVAAAERLLAQIDNVEKLLAPHMAIRELGQTAGGVADRNAYAS